MPSPSEFNLIPLDIPTCDGISKFFGYEGLRRYVAYYWSYAYTFSDGSCSGTPARWSCYVKYVQHRLVRNKLWPYILGGDDQKAVHWLLLDRDQKIFWIGHRDDVARFLNSLIREENNPPYPVAVDPDVLAQKLSALMVPQPPEEMAARMKEDKRIISDFDKWISTWEVE